MSSHPPHDFTRVTLGAVTVEQGERVGRRARDPIVLSSTKHYGLVPSSEYFKNRTIYSDNLSNYKVVRRDWFAYATNHLSEGSIGIQEQFDEACVSPIYTVFSTAADVHPPLLFRLLKSWRFLNAYKLHEQATVDRRGAVRYRDFRKISLDLPPLPEQRQIAAILDTLDDAVRKTEQIIAKLKQVKQGLLHDLLTRGIDDNGELRCPERHPEQFKDSALGRIPRGWEGTMLGSYLASCGGFLQTGPFGSQLHSHEYSGEGVPVVMPQDISDDGVSSESVARIPERVASRLARHRMMPNDLVFARRGDLSRCAPIGTREVGWICGTGCLLARLPGQAVDAEWLAAAYRHDTIQRQVAGRAVGSTMVNLNTGILQSLVLRVPPGEEQRKISMLARAHGLRVAREGAQLAKLRLLKSGLMEDLLTGRVRVTALLPREGHAP